MVFNGDSDREDRLYTVLNVKFPKHPNGGMAVFLLDLKASPALEEAHVPAAPPWGRMCCVPWDSTTRIGQVRFSFSCYTPKRTSNVPWKL